MCFKQSQKPTLYSSAVMIANSFCFCFYKSNEIKHMATQLQRLHSIAIIIDRYNNNRYIIDIIIIKETL